MVTPRLPAIFADFGSGLAFASGSDFRAAADRFGVAAIGVSTASRFPLAPLAAAFVGIGAGAGAFAGFALFAVLFESSATGATFFAGALFVTLAAAIRFAPAIFFVLTGGTSLARSPFFERIGATSFAGALCFGLTVMAFGLTAAAIAAEIGFVSVAAFAAVFLAGFGAGT